MRFKKSVGISAMAAGIGVAGLLGLGIGTASADPGCDHPGAPPCGHHDDHGARPDDWRGRNIDAGRRDHQPFEWNGQRVRPMPAGDGHGWGFWFLDRWIPM